MNLKTPTRTLFAGLALSLFAAVQAAPSSSYEKYYDGLPFEMAKVETPVFPDYSVNIRDFGAVSDGVTLNTQAINRAIAHVHEKGGGRVVIPSGLWYTGPIQLLSNIDLHLEANALVVFTSDIDAYPIVATSFEGLSTYRCQSPLWALDADNIAITGKGCFDGAGQDWRPVKKGKLTAGQWKTLVAKEGSVLNEKKDIWYPSKESMEGAEACHDFNVPSGIDTKEQWEGIKCWLRPVLLNFTSCRKVLLQGVTFKNSPSWNVHPLMCTDLVVDDVTIINPWYAQNGDALDVESCKNVLIVNSTFDAGDDAICVKSGKDEVGRKRAIPCENVIVRDNKVLHGHGGFVVGSEMSGGVKNVFVSDCSFIGTDVGLRFKSTRGRGGVVEGIYINNIYMIDIPGEPLIFDLFYGNKGKDDAEAPVPPVTEETPVFKDIHISNVACKGAGRAMYFNGLVEMPIDGIHIEDVVITGAKKGIEINQAKNITIKNVRIDAGKSTAITLKNTSETILDNLQFPEQEAPVCIGDNCRKIKIVNTGISKKELKISEGTRASEVKVK